MRYLLIVALLLGGYLCGCITTGFFIGKIYGMDIRSKGSGNVGTTNALRTLGWKAGLLTFVGDCLKALIPTLLVRLFLYTDVPYYNYILVLITGLGVVLGHNFPFHLKFKGGKGIAVTAGVIVASTNWITVAIGLPIFIIIVALTRYVSVGSLIVALIMPIYTLIMWRGYPYFAAMLCLAIAFTVLAYIKHAQNIKRLFNGTENKLSFSKK